ncbi:hypothetical protein [Streptomyces sp. CA-251251]|uniref:hypothetical protein n=1 Tax=Streptomyces sp. CA-251251 TaxID=3240063 RepID=UPI003D927B46
MSANFNTNVVGLVGVVLEVIIIGTVTSGLFQGDAVVLKTNVVGLRSKPLGPDESANAVTLSGRAHCCRPWKTSRRSARASTPRCACCPRTALPEHGGSFWV